MNCLARVAVIRTERQPKPRPRNGGGATCLARWTPVTRRLVESFPLALLRQLLSHHTPSVLALAQAPEDKESFYAVTATSRI